MPAVSEPLVLRGRGRLPGAGKRGLSHLGPQLGSQETPVAEASSLHILLVCDSPEEPGHLTEARLHVVGRSGD